MLTVSTVSTASALVAPRTISAKSGSTNTVIYTVPSGRVFNGIAICQNGYGQLSINGVEVYSSGTGVSTGISYFPLNGMQGGTVFTNGVSYVGFAILGVES